MIRRTFDITSDLSQSHSFDIYVQDGVRAGVKVHHTKINTRILKSEWTDGETTGSSPAHLQQPLLRPRGVAYRHGDVTFDSRRLRGRQTLTDGHLVHASGLLWKQERM